MPGNSVEDSLDAIIRHSGGVGSGLGSGIEQLSPIDFELGAAFIFKANQNDKLNFYGKTLNRVEQSDGNSNTTFKSEHQFSCAPSNTTRINSGEWSRNFPIQ